ncbi:DUF3261 domain-containing protein [Vibrio sp. T187]|uniref:DUF3261 domain-containing protein n=1 Tax=Vibrio TaxID=662 RepID=UPI0010CA0930|nr:MULTISPECIES: DUF3261 domain-containing protein [Vibrio]MBW3696318.1 DUF3261 domain-containing protein [Vibrio sp. T187]
MKLLLIFVALVSLTACSLQPLTSTTPSVEISQGIQLHLPTPGELGYQVTATQLVSATWDETTQQLPVQLEVTSEQINLAGFSSWGTRILTLKYQDNRIETSVLNGLEGKLPQPEQVLFNLMLTLWPMQAWHQPLSAIGWQMVESDNRRIVFDSDDQKIIEITYQDSTSAKDRLNGSMTFQHLQLSYLISIQTLNHTITQ